MAIYHLNAKVHGRGTDPKLHALRSYAYRSGTRIVDPITGRIYNYQSKQAEVVLTETMTPRDIIVPDWMRDGPQLWQKVQAMETAVRRDAQIFREIECALPVELSLTESATLLRGFITEQLTDAGMVSSYSIHFKHDNPHVHIMATLRGIEIAGNDSDVSYDGNDNATDPIRFGHKNRDWNSKAMLGQWRKAWADHVNAALVKAGSDQRVTHQSFATLGRQNEPTVHVGPDFKRGDGYQAKRVARLQSNEQVTQRNKQRGEQRRHAAHKALMAGVCGAKLSVALQGQNNDYAQALTPVHHLIDDMAALLHQVQAVANAMERPLSSGALAKRVARILDAVPPPQNQAELQTALLAMEVVFAAKRRPQFVAAVLDAIPTEQRQHFENIVASVLGTTPMDAGHDMAALALSAANQWEVQAQWSIRQVLSDFQLADYPARCQAMVVIGKSYTWRDFEQDIQRFAHSDAGWQRAWWDEQVKSLTGEALADFGKVVPTWFEVGKPKASHVDIPESHAEPVRHVKTYPLGAYDPNPEQTLMAALNRHQELHPVPDAPELAHAAASVNVNIWGGMPAGLVVAPQPIRTREVNNPWGITPDDAGGGTQPYSGSTGPNGW
jgi:hypothetical protein